MWVIRMGYEHHLVCYDPVFHFSLRINIRIAPTGRVAVEVAHYDPSFSIRLNMETECLWWRRVQVVDRQSISFKQQSRNSCGSKCRPLFWQICIQIDFVFNNLKPLSVEIYSEKDATGVQSISCWWKSENVDPMRSSISVMADWCRRVLHRC